MRATRSIPNVHVAPASRAWMLAMVFALSLVSCATWKAPDEKLPAWLEDRLSRSGSGILAPVAVWRGRFQGQVTYLIQSRCCDLPNSLYDETGTYLCTYATSFTPGHGACPEGGRGDGARQKLVWERRWP